MTTDHNVAITAEMQGTIVTWEVTAGTSVRQGQVLGMLESMKLHHDIVAPTQGVLSAVAVEVGSTVKPGDVIASINASSEAQDDAGEAAEEVSASGPLGLDRPDLAEVVERHAIGLDA
ncbi:MAG: acetyl-CoA carboxylase biotin carboxyl carrier protein subunit, partial [Ilumatobacteraceae bacterium]